MAQVITFENYRPTPRYDSIAWTDVRVYEAATADAADVDWTLIDTITLSPVDADPSDPAARDITTELASDTDELWYRLVFVDATGDTLAPTVPVQNVDSPAAYATVDELARILKIRVPTAEQVEAMERVLLVAAGEIDAEVDLPSGGLSGWQVALAAEVNLERAVEHWRQMETPFGLMVLGVDTPAERTGRDSWERHALKLAPLKGQWGFA
jgi:hypothetical protein